jgi:hypothetical protein
MTRESLLLYAVLLIGPFLVFGMLRGWRKSGRRKRETDEDHPRHS